MTDIDITAEPNSLPDYSCVSNINISEIAAEMVMTRSQSREMETTGDVPITNANPEDGAAAARDREGLHMIGGVEWPVPWAFERIRNDDFKTISTMHCLSRRAILSYDFERLEEYAWAGQFFWGDDCACVRSRVL